MSINPREVAKRRKTRVLHGGYQYEGKLLRGSIDNDLLANPHVSYIVGKIDLLLAKVTAAIGQIENFFNIAEDKQIQ